MNNYRHITDLVTRGVLYYRALLKPDDMNFSLIDKTKQGNLSNLTFLLTIKNNKNKPIQCFDVTWECRDEKVLEINTINGVYFEEIASFEIQPKDVQEFEVVVRLKANTNEGNATAESMSEEIAEPHVLGIHYAVYGFGKKKSLQKKRFDITKSVNKFFGK